MRGKQQLGLKHFLESLNTSALIFSETGNVLVQAGDVLGRPTVGHTWLLWLGTRWQRSIVAAYHTIRQSGEFPDLGPNSLLIDPRTSVLVDLVSPSTLSVFHSCCFLVGRPVHCSFTYHQTMSNSIKQVLWSSGYDSRLGFATAINCERSPVRVRARPCSFAFVMCILLILVLLSLVRQARSL
jgi:hypothetical protein